MGKLDGGIFGVVTNKVGGVVFSTWKGINVVKKYQPNVANPKTPKQLEVRDRFKACGEFARDILGNIVRPLMNNAAPYMSGYNYFVKVNLDIFDSEGLIPKPESLKISDGSMEAPRDLAVTVDTATDTATVTWDDSATNPDESGDDQIYLVVYTGDPGKPGGSVAAAAPRSAGTYAVPFDGARIPEISTVWVAAAFKATEGSLTSETATVSVNP